MTPQMVQIIHLAGRGWSWTVYDGGASIRGCESSFDGAWQAIQAIIAPPVGRVWELSGLLAAEAG